MSQEMAIRIFNESYPNYKIRLCFEQDADHFVIMAMPDDGQLYYDPYFAINKNTGQVSSFSPFGTDLGPLFDAMYGSEHKE